jgi:hypothetical protein
MTNYQNAYTTLMQSTSQSGTASYSGIWVQTAVALCTAAKAIVDESPMTTDHDKRMKWAKMVLQDPSIYGHIVAYGVMLDSTIVANGTGASTDAEVQAAVDALVTDLVNGMAG